MMLGRARHPICMRNRASFRLPDGRELHVKALGGRLQCALDGLWHRAFVRMAFREDGTVELPELPLTLPLEDQDRPRLQDLAAFAGIGASFREAKGLRRRHSGRCGAARRSGCPSRTRGCNTPAPRPLRLFASLLR